MAVVEQAAVQLRERTGADTTCRQMLATNQDPEKYRSPGNPKRLVDAKVAAEAFGDDEIVGR